MSLANQLMNSVPEDKWAEFIDDQFCAQMPIEPSQITVKVLFALGMGAVFVVVGVWFRLSAPVAQAEFAMHFIWMGLALFGYAAFVHLGRRLRSLWKARGSIARRAVDIAAADESDRLINRSPSREPGVVLQAALELPEDDRIALMTRVIESLSDSRKSNVCG